MLINVGPYFIPTQYIYLPKALTFIFALPYLGVK
jgi:hypothetical protein